MKNRVYAYVTNECCASVRAVLPRTEINGKPVSRHGDYSPWYYGQRATRERITDGATGYERICADAVSALLGW